MKKKMRCWFTARKKVNVCCCWCFCSHRRSARPIFWFLFFVFFLLTSIVGTAEILIASTNFTEIDIKLVLMNRNCVHNGHFLGKMLNCRQRSRLSQCAYLTISMLKSIHFSFNRFNGKRSHFSLARCEQRKQSHAPNLKHKIHKRPINNNKVFWLADLIFCSFFLT